MLVCIYIYIYIRTRIYEYGKWNKISCVNSHCVSDTHPHTIHTHIGMCKAGQRKVCSHLLRTRHTFTCDTHIYRNV